MAHLLTSAQVRHLAKRPLTAAQVKRLLAYGSGRLVHCVAVGEAEGAIKPSLEAAEAAARQHGGRVVTRLRVAYIGDTLIADPAGLCRLTYATRPIARDLDIAG